MGVWLTKYKPAASVRTQVMLAASLWTLVGMGMLIAGAMWSISMRWPGVAVLIGIASVVGLLKARFALRKTACRVVERICRRGDGRCLGGFLSWRMWLFVAAMMVLGRLLRSGLLPLAMVAFIYVAVGVALLIGAITLWAAYSRLPRAA